MNLLKKTFYIDFFKKFFFIILVLIILLNKILDTRLFQIFVIILGLLILYFVFKKELDIQENYIDNDTQNKCVLYYNIDKNIKNLVDNLKLITNSKKVMDNALSYLNIFLNIHSNFKEKNIINTELFQEAESCRTVFLNELISIYVSDNINTIFYKKMKLYIEKIRYITYQYLVEIGEYLNIKWESTNNINTLSKPIFLSSIKPNPYSDVLYSKNFNIY